MQLIRVIVGSLMQENIPFPAYIDHEFNLRFKSNVSNFRLQTGHAQMIYNESYSKIPQLAKSYAICILKLFLSNFSQWIILQFIQNCLVLALKFICLRAFVSENVPSKLQNYIFKRDWWQEIISLLVEVTEFISPAESFQNIGRYE